LDAILEEYRYALQLMHDQSKYAESKNASLIVFTSAFAFGVISSIDNIRKLFLLNIFNFLPAYKEEVFMCGIVTLVIILTTSTVQALLSFFPQIRQTNLENRKCHNLFFFNSNTEFSNSIVMDRYYHKRYKSPSRLKIDMCNQILNLSKITERKYRYFRKATLTLLISPVILIIICIVVNIIA
jgi:hypothetical protein